MLKKLLFLTSAMFFGQLAAQAEDWYLIGSICNWDTESAIQLKELPDGSYSAEIASLDGEFKFIADKSWTVNIGADRTDVIYGNCQVHGSRNGYNFIVNTPLENVTITLNPATDMITFAGLKENQQITENWYLVGDFSDWSPTEGLLMEKKNDSKYSITVPSLEGNFKFRLNDGWDYPVGPGVITDIFGNCEAVVEKNGNVFSSNPALKNVTITFDPDAMRVVFSGLPKDQELPEYDPYVSAYGCFFIQGNEYNPTGNVFWEKEDGIFQYSSTLYVDEPFYLSTAQLKYNLPYYGPEAWDIMLNYLLGGGSENQILSPNGTYSLHTPCESFEGWSVEKNGYYTITVDTNNMTLSIVESDQNLYILGDIYNEDGIANNWKAPSLSNKEWYDQNFKLTKVGDTYKGSFLIKNIEYYEGGAQFRFVNELNGWDYNYSLGSTEYDFSYIPVIFEDGSATSNIIKRGLGNWLITVDKDQWVAMEVNLNSMTVKFSLAESGVAAVEADNEADVRWYNLQGIPVENPEKGVFIKVAGNKTEKVIL